MTELELLRKIAQALCDNPPVTTDDWGWYCPCCEKERDYLPEHAEDCPYRLALQWQEKYGERKIPE